MMAAPTAAMLAPADTAAARAATARPAESVAGLLVIAAVLAIATGVAVTSAIPLATVRPLFSAAYLHTIRMQALYLLPSIPLREGSAQSWLRAWSFLYHTQTPVALLAAVVVTFAEAAAAWAAASMVMPVVLEVSMIATAEATGVAAAAPSTAARSPLAEALLRTIRMRAPWLLPTRPPLEGRVP